MKLYFIFLFLTVGSIVYAQEKKILITASSVITLPGIEGGTISERYIFTINSTCKDEIKEIWFKDDHIFSNEEINLTKGTNQLIIEYWRNQREGTVFTKVTLNSVDITEVCLFEPMDQINPFGIFKFKKSPEVKLTKFEEQSVIAMP